MKSLLLSVLIFLAPTLAYAEGADQCVNPNWNTVEYTHEVRGEVKLFITPLNYKITATNLACIIAIEVLKRVDNMPSKMTLGLVSIDYRNTFMVQWSFPEDRFTIIEASIPPREYRTVGIFTMYPEPLSRIKEVMIVKRMPRMDELPAYLQHNFKTNYVPTTLMQIRKLVEHQ